MEATCNLTMSFSSSSLFDAAFHCLMLNEVADKLTATHQLFQAWQAGDLLVEPEHAHADVEPVLAAGLPATLQLVTPRQLPKRGLQSAEGIIALLHAISHIEFNAINLALDAVYRFRTMPRAYYDDWIRIAEEEAYHFELLQKPLTRLGSHYGALVAHNGLWEMAVDTMDDVLVRMALVPRVLEARGLDATPSIIEKLKQQRQHELVEILEIILREEIGHVAVGTHWFNYCCQQRALVPDVTFRELLMSRFRGSLRNPMNTEARIAAGFSAQELEQLIALYR